MHGIQSLCLPKWFTGSLPPGRRPERGDDAGAGGAACVLREHRVSRQHVDMAPGPEDCHDLVRRVHQRDSVSQPRQRHPLHLGRAPR